MSAVALLPSSVAVMTAVPLVIAVTSPDEETVATDSSEDVNTGLRTTLRTVISLFVVISAFSTYSVFTSSLTVSPARSSARVGVSVTDNSFSGLSGSPGLSLLPFPSHAVNAHNAKERQNISDNKIINLLFVFANINVPPF